MAKGDWNRLPERRWTRRQDELLDRGLERGISLAQIAAQVKRTAVAVKVRCKRRGISIRAYRPMSARQVARRLGIPDSDGKTVVRWIERGLLKGHASAVGAGRGLRHVVTEEALFEFMANERTWPAWRVDRIPDPALREWAAELRAGTRFLRVGEVAERLFVNIGTVWDWVTYGHLRSIQWGNHWIRESDLAGFVPPGMRSRLGLQPGSNRYTADEDAIIEQMVAMGEPWELIAVTLMRPERSVAGRFYRMRRARKEALAA